MFKLLTPIIGIVVALGLFFTYVQPTFQDVKAVQNETMQYAEAVNRASELQQRIAELRSQQSAIALSDLERLEAFLPDRINEVALLIDLDALATNSNLSLSEISVEKPEEEDSDAAAQALPTDAETDSSFEPVPEFGNTPNSALSGQYTTLDISFTVTGTYNDFREFLSNLEQSLVLMEVVKINFSDTEGDLVPFDLTIRFYSLNAPV